MISENSTLFCRNQRCDAQERDEAVEGMTTYSRLRDLGQHQGAIREFHARKGMACFDLDSEKLTRWQYGGRLTDVNLEAETNLEVDTL